MRGKDNAVHILPDTPALADKGSGLHAIVLVLPYAASCSLALPHEDGFMWKRGLILLLAVILIGLDLVVGLRSHIINQPSARPAPAA